MPKPDLKKPLDVFQPDALELVGFTFYGITYDEKERELGNATLTASVKFRNHGLTRRLEFLE